jgi:hypothetical protein
MALILVLIGATILYLINGKKLSNKTTSLKIWWFIIYAGITLVGLLLFFEILHIIKYHSVG